MLYERLKELRKAKGLSQKDCALELGMPDASKYNKWENGANRPDYEMVCQLAKYFNVTTDYLLGVIDDRKEPIDKLRAERDGLLKEIERLTDIVDKTKYILSKA